MGGRAWGVRGCSPASEGLARRRVWCPWAPGASPPGTPTATARLPAGAGRAELGRGFPAEAARRARSPPSAPLLTPVPLPLLLVPALFLVTAGAQTTPAHGRPRQPVLSGPHGFLISFSFCNGFGLGAFSCMESEKLRIYSRSALRSP